MISEVSSTEFDRYGNMSKPDSSPTTPSLYEKVFVPAMNAPLSPDFRAEGKVEYEWGGEGGGKGKIGASAGIRDSKGNEFDVSIKQDSSGNGNVSASVSYDSSKSESK